MAKTQTLEQSFEKLEEIIANLEDENVGLDAAFRLYKEGIKLVENCNKQLDKVEKQIVVLENED